MRGTGKLSAFRGFRALILVEGLNGAQAKARKACCLQFLGRFLFAATLMGMSQAEAGGTQAPQSGSGWFFRATGGDPSDQLAGTSFPLQGKAWAPVSLPHCFDRIQPANDVYAWYVRELRLPATYRGLDLIVDLGIIDDADRTLFNGQEVGRMGNFRDKSQSAWNRDRRYTVPATLVRHDSPNTLAVQVRDFTGLGGLLGVPQFGTILPKARTCRFISGDQPAAVQPDFDDLHCTEIRLPDTEFDKRMARNPAYGWYRLRFDLPPGLATRDLLLDLGVVYDVAECYLNGKLIGRAGTFPPDFLPQTGGRFRCIAPAEAVQPEGNVLAIRAYNDTDFGGIVGVPSISFELQERLTPLGATLAQWAKNLQEVLENSEQIAAALDLSEYMVGSLLLDQAITVCEAIAAAAATGSAARQKARGRIVYTRWLRAEPDEAWREFQNLDFSLPIPFEAAYAAAKSHNRAIAAGCPILYLGKDRFTRGDWDLHYGVQEAVLCGMGSPYNASFGVGPGLRFSLSTGDRDESPRAWLGARETADARALFLPTSKKRRYSSWDDCGEVRPFDDNGPDLVLSVIIPKGSNLLSLYLVDFDWYQTEHPRLQTISAFSDDGKPLMRSWSWQPAGSVLANMSGSLSRGQAPSSCGSPSTAVHVQS